MSDVATLRMNPGPQPKSGFRSHVSGRRDPAISVDVGMVVTLDPQSSVGKGSFVYFAAADDDEALATVYGLAFYAGEANHVITVQYSGPLSLPTTQWDRVTGGSGGLTPGAIYYLSNTDGMLTDDPTGTTWTTQVGKALSATTLLIAIQPAEATSP